MQPRVLNVIATRPEAGIKTVLENYEKFFEKNIIYDFMVFDDNPTGVFDIQMKAHKRKIHLFKSLSIKNIINVYEELNTFFKENKNKYNIVHIHTPNVAFIVAPIAKKNGIKIIIGHSHATKYSDKILSKLRNFILLANRNYYFTNICGCSSEALRFLSRFTIKKNKFIIKNAIDISKFKFNHGHRKIFREEFKIKENQILVGCIGRFNNQKNQKFLLDVFYDLKKNNEFHLILIGSGPNKKNIEEYIKRKKMHNVTITDPRDDIYKIYSALDILVLPSKFEGLPMVAVEGLASGLPVILSNKITKDLLCKQTTYLSINNYKFWSEAISNTNLSNYREREKANILEELNYDIKKEQSNLIEYYEQLIYGGGIDGK